MAALQMTITLLAPAGPLEQAIAHAHRIHNHIQSYEQNHKLIPQLITSLIHVRNDLRQLQSHFETHTQSIPQHNNTILHTQMMKMNDILSDVEASLSSMEPSDGNVDHFRETFEWSKKYQHLKLQLNNTQPILLQMNSILASTATLPSELVKTENDTHSVQKSDIETIETHKGSAAASSSVDLTYHFQEKLRLYTVVVPDFSSTDTEGKPSTIEGKLRLELLNSTQSYDKIFAIQGPSGVGKTTILQMLSRDQQVLDHYSELVYHVNLGADARISTVITQIANVVRKSGGVKQALRVHKCRNLTDAMSLVSEWFIEKKFLILIDDVSEHKQLGSTFLTLLKGMITISDNAAMVFTTRDPSIAACGKVFQLDCKETQGPESRMILFRHARQDDQCRLNDPAEKAITYLLHICKGLPTALSVVGKTVRQYSMRRNIRTEDAWNVYARRQSKILDVVTDEHDNLSSLFSAALHVLDEDPSENTLVTELNRSYSYQEMHQALCVLEKQQRVPLNVLGDLWNISNEEDVRNVCHNFVSVGLAEWYDEESKEDHCAERISMHDLAHEFATKQAEKNVRVSVWHQRLLERYANRTELSYCSSYGCREWWTTSNDCSQRDGGYFLRNLCRHLSSSMPHGNEVLMLVTRPQWIGMQVSQNGILQYERDVSFARRYLERNNYDGLHMPQDNLPYVEMGVEELEMILHATRLSVSFLTKNPIEVWFQLYGRLLRTRSFSKKIKRYLDDMITSDSQPWIQPIETVDDLLTDIKRGVSCVVNIGISLTCMEKIPGECEVICGCINGELVIVNMEECVQKKQWKAHQSHVSDIAMARHSMLAVSVSNDGIGKVWEVGSWHEVGKFQLHFDGFQHVRFSNNEKYVYTTSTGRGIQIWDLENKQCIWKTTCVERVSTIAVLDDDERILTNCDESKIIKWKIHVYDKNQGSQENTAWIEPAHKIDHTKISMMDYVSCIEISDNIPRMAIGYENGSIQIWNTKKMIPIGIPLRIYGDAVDCIALNTDGTKVACTSNKSGIAVGDVTNGEMICDPCHGHTDRITDLKFIEKLNEFVSCSRDGTVRILKMNGMNSKGSAVDCSLEKYIFVRLSTDESRFLSKCDDRSVAVWDAATGQLIGESKKSGKYVDAIAAMNGKWFITIERNGVITMNNVDKPKSMRPLNSIKTPVNCVDIAWSCKFIVAGSFDKTIRIWNLNQPNECHDKIDTADEILRVLVSTDEKRIISVSDEVVEVWSIKTKGCLKRIHCFDAYYEPRDIIMHFAGENVKEIDTKEPWVRIHHGNQVVWGRGSNAKVLATLQSPVCQDVYSPPHKMLCMITSKSRIRFLQVK